MAQTVIVTLTSAGSDSGPFNLYSNIDGYTTAFAFSVSKSALLAGYTSVVVPDLTTSIRIMSVGTCTNYIDVNVSGITTTTTTSTTSTSTTSTTSTTTSTTTVPPIPITTTTTTTTAAPVFRISITNAETACSGVPDWTGTATFVGGLNTLCNSTSITITSNTGTFDSAVGNNGFFYMSDLSNSRYFQRNGTLFNALPQTSCVACVPATTTTTTTIAPAPTTCPPISNTIRLATLADVGVIPNASVGDLIVFGPNDGTGLFIKNINSPIASLAPGAKILIRGGYSYDFIEINSNLAGTLANPIVITNFCGQVETESFGVVGMSHFKLTSKYDPANKTGDINYPGHAAGYAWSQGKYGIFINAKWLQIDTSLLYITSGIPIGSTTKSKTDNYEVEYIESGNGGYSNAFRWDDNNTFDILDNIRIHDNYFHDIRGEAIYMGIAASRKAGYEIFQNLKVYNNRILRSGAEGIQIKRIGTGSEIYNNASVNTGLGCVDSQNFSTVLWPVNGDTSVNNNLFVGNSGYSPVQWYIVNDPQYVPSATTASFVRNAMLHLGVDETRYAGIRGFFMKGFDVVNDVNIPNVPPIAQEISSNYWGFFDTLPMYVNEPLVDSFYTPIPSSPVYSRNNTYTQKNTFWGGTSPTISTNNVNGTVNDVSFVNFSYGVDFDWSRFRYWNNDAGLRNYTTGWYVTYKSKIYKAIANSSNIEPGVTAGWQTYWELKTYNGGTSFFPADDIRVSSGNFYNTNNIGLVDKP